MTPIMSDGWSPIFEGAPERRLPVGSSLFHRGDPVTHLFHLREGRVALRRALCDGGALTLHLAGPGEIVAAASLWAEATQCDAVCETDVRLAVRPASAVRAWLGAAPAATGLVEAARHVQAPRARVEVLRLRDRLDAYLDLHGPPEPGSWVRVADWIGVTAPALYRELGRRREAGWRHGCGRVPCVTSSEAARARLPATYRPRRGPTHDGDRPG